MSDHITEEQVIELQNWAREFSKKVEKYQHWHHLLNSLVVFLCLVLLYRIVFTLGSIADGGIYYLSALLAGVVTYSLFLFFSKQKHIRNTILSIFTLLITLTHWENHSSAAIALFILTLLSVVILLDRVRKTSVYSLLPEGKSLARSLGTGFWATLVGGGPWGQPCPLIHHLCPTLPWYGQIMGHYKLAELLNEEQKKTFMPLEKRNFLFFYVDIFLTKLNFSNRTR